MDRFARTRLPRLPPAFHVKHACRVRLASGWRADDNAEARCAIKESAIADGLAELRNVEYRGSDAQLNDTQADRLFKFQGMCTSRGGPSPPGSKPSSGSPLHKAS